MGVLGHQLDHGWRLVTRRRSLVVDCRSSGLSVWDRSWAGVCDGVGISAEHTTEVEHGFQCRRLEACRHRAKTAHAGQTTQAVEGAAAVTLGNRFQGALALIRSEHDSASHHK